MKVVRCASRGPHGGLMGGPLGGLSGASWGPLGGLLGASLGPLGGPLGASLGLSGAKSPSGSSRAVKVAKDPLETTLPKWVPRSHFGALRAIFIVKTQWFC